MTHLRFFKYIAVGVVSAALYVGLTVALSKVFGSASFVITASSFVIATVVNYLLHYWLTFQSSEQHLKVGVRFGLLVAFGALASGLVNTGLISIGLSVLVSSTVFAVLWALISYQLNARFVFQ